MNALVIYSQNRVETQLLRDTFRAVAGFQLSDEWSVRPAVSVQELKSVLQDGATAQICCTDITGAEGMEAAAATRQLFGSTQLVLIVSPALSPMSYIRPGIMPAGILFKPLSREAALPLLQELLQLIRREKQKDVFQGKVFTVNSHGTSYRIPMDEILYFEARNKKLYLYTQNAEIEFYDTLERLLERLPEQFVRCHKSFVVNKTAVEQISMAQNMITMGEGCVQIPISRSYRPAVREKML